MTMEVDVQGFVNSLQGKVTRVEFDVLKQFASELSKKEERIKELEGKVEFYREATSKVRELVSKSKDIGHPCQPLYDAIADKITELQSENKRLKEALEKIKGWCPDRSQFEKTITKALSKPIKP